MKNAAVIGLGTMGPGIAATLARAGMKVTAFDADPEKRAKAGEGFAGRRRRASGARGPRSKRRRDRGPREFAARGRGRRSLIETVPENLELKIQVFREIEAQVADDCLLASDTSGIPITKIQAGTRVPGRVVGMHWSNPPHIIPMIEVIAGEQTAPGVVRRSRN